MRMRKPTPLLTHGEVTVRLLSLGDAKTLQTLLATNRGWLSQWEASLPDRHTYEPGSYSLRPGIRSMLKNFREGRGIPFVMTYRGEVVGQLSVSDISWGALRSASIGYWIAEDYAGLGITPTSVALVIDYVLTRFGLHRIEICLRPENVQSRRVVEKLGLRYEGRRENYIFIDGAWRDHDCFAILTEEVGKGVLERLKPAKFD